MTKTAANSQAKTVYKVEFRCLGDNIASLRLSYFGGSCTLGVDVQRAAEYVAQIDAALADGAREITLAYGRKVTASEKILRGIRASLENFLVSRGGSGSQVVGGGVSTPVKGATPVVRGGKPDSEEPASKAKAPMARKFTCPALRKPEAVRLLSASGDKFNNHQKSGRRKSNAGSKSPAAAAATARPLKLRTLQQSACADEYTSEEAEDGAASLKQTIDEIISEIDSVIELIKDCTADIAALAKSRRQCGEFSPRVKTVRGRTSVVVATHKVS